MKLYSTTFELSGVFMVRANNFDEAMTEAGDALLGLEEIYPGVQVEVHAISFDPNYDEDD